MTTITTEGITHEHGRRRDWRANAASFAAGVALASSVAVGLAVAADSGNADAPAGNPSAVTIDGFACPDGRGPC